jgi:WXXGXW repeat (2 copies)
MTYTNLFKRSLGTAALTGALFIAPIAAIAQAPYGAPTPDQYAAQNPQYANPQDQNNDPNNGQYAPQQGAPQPGVPQGIEQAPPAIPDYAQPEAPGDGYIWTPGYWAWTGEGYEWVNGAWVNAPYTGALWTPGYWGDGYNGYYWNAGYWGPVVGYYGGINYGFGYFGIGFYGGYWGGGRFWYNRPYCNIGLGRGFNVYSRSYGGFSARPGGASFVRANGYSGNHGGAGFAANRGSAVNGYARSSGFAQASNRPATGGYNNGAARSYAQPAAQSHANYSGGGAAAHSAPAGGGGAPHGGGGGGGGSHGGGGGGGHR